MILEDVLGITLISAYLNNHQLPLLDALCRRVQGNCCFIETLNGGSDVKRLSDVDEIQSCVLRRYASEEYDSCSDMVNNSRVVLAGSVFDDLLRERIRERKLLFRYAERPLKNGREPLKYIPRLAKWRCQNPKKAPIYLLCASAFAAGDYKRYGLFDGRCYKWGYFPKLRKYDGLKRLFAVKQSSLILWCGRLLDWKHPELALEVALHLRGLGCDFKLMMIGDGPLRGKLQQLIFENDLQGSVSVCGEMTPDSVRNCMEEAGVFLFTSDRREGWGAVVNEAMNSGCAVVASDAAGSVPYLIRDGENGLVYHCGNLDDLVAKTKILLSEPQLQRELGGNAYRTILDEWNAELAAERVISLSEAVLEGEPSPDIFENGPCSRAQIIKDDWYANRKTHFKL